MWCVYASMNVLHCIHIDIEPASYCIFSRLVRGRLALFVAESNEMKWNSGWKTSFTSSKARVAPSNSWSVCLRLCRANQWSCPIGSGIGLHIMFVLYIDQLAKIHLIKFVSTPLTKYLLVMWKYVLESQVETILLNRRVLLIYYFTLGRRMANEAVC